MESNFFSACRLLLVCLQVGESAFDNRRTLKQALPFYHSSEELQMQLLQAVKTCRTGQVTLEAHHAKAYGRLASLDVVTIRSAEANQSSGFPRRKAVFVFGEHARELVTSESGVHFVNSLCGAGTLALSKAQQALANMDLWIVPNANPLSRKLVESGTFCKRTNENGVDLNRNWGGEVRDGHTDFLGKAEAQVGADDDDLGRDPESPGVQAFSEGETQILRDLVKTVSPDLYVTVHSGTYMMGVPYGSSSKDVPPHATEMTKMLEIVNKQQFGGQIPYGNLANLIGYNSQGCSLDFVTDKLHVPFAFALEIFSGQSNNVYLNEHMKTHKPDSSEHKHFLRHDESMDSEPHQKHHQNKQRGNRRTTRKHRQSLLEKPTSNDGQQHVKAMTPKPSVISSLDADIIQGHMDRDEKCLADFNPLKEGVLHKVLRTWTEAYVDIATQVAASSK